MLLPYIFSGLNSISWKIKKGSLELLEVLSKTASKQIGNNLHEIIPKIVKEIWDTKIEVKNAAKKCLKECFINCNDNTDIDCILDDIAKAVEDPNKNSFALEKLSSTTFVSEVKRSTISIIFPILKKSLRQQKNSQEQRKAVVILSNMLKLVVDENAISPFKDIFLNELKKIAEDASNPTLRETANEPLQRLIEMTC